MTTATRFVKDMRRASYAPRDYHGRNYYHGPAVECPAMEEFQAIMRATSLTLQWDDLGKGRIVYPILGWRDEAERARAFPDDPAATR